MVQFLGLKVGMNLVSAWPILSARLQPRILQEQCHEWPIPQTWSCSIAPTELKTKSGPKNTLEVGRVINSSHNKNYSYTQKFKWELENWIIGIRWMWGLFPCMYLGLTNHILGDLKEMQSNFKKICRYFKIYSYFINILLLQKGITTLRANLENRLNHI